jgi:hypothetical protein
VLGYEDGRMSACVGVAADREDIAVCPDETVTLSVRCTAGYITPYEGALVINSVATGPEFRSTLDLIKLTFLCPSATQSNIFAMSIGPSVRPRGSTGLHPYGYSLSFVLGIFYVNLSW